MDYLESTGMKNQIVYRYWNNFKTLAQTAKATTSQQAPKKDDKKKEKKKGQDKPFTYNFDNDAYFKQLRILPDENRMHEIKKEYELPKEISQKHENEFIIGNITRIQLIVEEPEKYYEKTCVVAGWARNARDADKGQIVFIELNDGSTIKNIQCVINQDLANFKEVLANSNVGAAFRIKGKLIKSPAKGQPIEMTVGNTEGHYCKVVGPCQEFEGKKYPMGGKQISLEKMREIAHLRCRSRVISAVHRIRNNLAYATHTFFQSHGFQYVHTPIITASDCEGAGEMFQVTTTLPKPDETIDNIPQTKDKKVDYSKDFYYKPSMLTVSGQLAVENYACGIGNVYTFGPTFRSEKSHTKHHLSEFWMIEPEIIFADLADDMDLAEAYLKFCVNYVLKNNKADVDFCSDRIKFQLKEDLKKNPKDAKKINEQIARNEKCNLIQYLEKLISKPFARCSYTDAIKLLQIAVEKGKVFENKVDWHDELYKEHESFLAEYIFERPVMVYDYPEHVKSFYMRLNDDKITVQAFDMLCPDIGELIGGSVREERYDVLLQRVKDKGLNAEDYWAYFDLRKFGSVPHAGFGLGFERLVMMVSGMENIRDVIPFPRWEGNNEF